jgi:signal transduction histidine kinase
MQDLELIAGGRLCLDLHDAPVADLVRAAVDSIERPARERGLTIDVSDIDPAITVYVDAGRLVQALGNLLSNATKFSPAGGVIQVGAERQGGSVRVSVRDNGEGIPEDFRERIFGRFAQAGDSARQKGGAGLGLHITRQLVEQMRGSVGFFSEAGAGATFWVELPVVSRRGALRTG